MRECFGQGEGEMEGLRPVRVGRTGFQGFVLVRFCLALLSSAFSVWFGCLLAFLMDMDVGYLETDEIMIDG